MALTTEHLEKIGTPEGLKRVFRAKRKKGDSRDEALATMCGSFSAICVAFTSEFPTADDVKAEMKKRLGDDFK